MQAIKLNPEVIKDLKAGKVKGVTPEMVERLELVGAEVLEITDTYISAETPICIEIYNLNQTIFDYSIL